MAGVTGSGVSYLMLGVADVDRSVAFYESTLGRPIQFRVEGLAFVDGGAVTIGLSRDLGKARQPLAGAVEIVFRVESVTASWEALKAKGVPFVRDPRQVNDQDWAATMEDPDGHYLTVIGPKAQGARPAICH
jgi:predicted enzyme related to lactoylglutathione lyase